MNTEVHRIVEENSEVIMQWLHLDTMQKMLSEREKATNKLKKEITSKIVEEKIQYIVHQGHRLLVQKSEDKPTINSILLFRIAEMLRGVLPTDVDSRNLRDSSLDIISCWFEKDAEEIDLVEQQKEIGKAKKIIGDQLKDKKLNCIARRDRQLVIDEARKKEPINGRSLQTVYTLLYGDRFRPTL